MPIRRTPADSGERPNAKHDRPGYHDPLAGIGGAAPAQSALTLRLVLASVGLLFSVGGAVALTRIGAPTWIVVLLALVAATAVVDLVVLVRRKRRGESG
jgi:hypothetical protein